MSTTPTITADHILAAGGREWQGRRIYLNATTREGAGPLGAGPLCRLIGLEVGFYGTGNVSWAKLRGQKFSNAKASQKLDNMSAYWDFEAARLVTTGLDEDDVRHLNESLLTVD
jgi:hypothetical protein